MNRSGKSHGSTKDVQNWPKETSQTAKLQVPSRINGDSPNNEKHEASWHFRNKERENISERQN
jgi:hypothetical protein